MQTIYMIRHGQSVANTGAVSQPDKRIPLTEVGLAQAQSLLERWQALQQMGKLPLPRHIYYSQMLRAKQTASPFIDHYQLPDDKNNEIEMLNEFACLSYKTVEGMVGKQRAPLAQQYWQTADIHYRDGADADTFNEFVARVDRFIASAPRLEHNSLCFGHGIWIGLLAYRLLGCPITSNAEMQQLRQFQTAIPMHNTVVYRLDISDEGIMQLRVVHDLKG